jgi:hypothetical protein
LRELILGFIRPDSKPEDILKLIDEIGHDLSHWSGLLNVCFENTALPLLYYSLHRSGLDNRIPEEVKEILKKAYLRNSGRNFILQQELIKILKALQERGIPVILLKGAIALIENLYPDKNVRIMCDLDLLMKKEEFGIATEVLRGLHYLPQNDGNEGENKMTLAKSNGIILEIHSHPLWEKFESYLPVDHVWSHAWEKNWYGIKFLLPSPTDQLYHLLIHEILQHQQIINFRISAMYEVYFLLSFYRERIDFDTFFQRAKKYKLEELFSFYLFLTEENIGSVLPPSIKGNLKLKAGISLRRYEKVLQMTRGLIHARKRFFLILTMSDSPSSYIKNLYRVLCKESVFLMSDRVLLSRYGLTKFPAPVMILIKGLHLVRMLLGHMAVTFLFLIPRPQHIRSHSKIF